MEKSLSVKRAVAVTKFVEEIVYTSEKLAGDKNTLQRFIDQNECETGRDAKNKTVNEYSSILVVSALLEDIVGLTGDSWSKRHEDMHEIRATIGNMGGEEESRVLTGAGA
ncbi:hypothetical protein PoB_000626000 [Plakobranchus ocellatus]|uniref:Uncharacterized protein n=1 Tax=Plakobranchus ocellatus TaxID=259542 RepID=A0AAV3YAF5_9GAST|nr:hypothetical protein PoB_000626000 [Plakobranchus ocellatus]